MKQRGISLKEALNSAVRVGLPWLVLLHFSSWPPGQDSFKRCRFDLIDAWLQQSSVTLPEPTPRHLQTMRDLIAPWFLPATSKRFSFVQ
jgi:hypothetical protein